MCHISWSWTWLSCQRRLCQMSSCCWSQRFAPRKGWLWYYSSHRSMAIWWDALLPPCSSCAIDGTILSSHAWSRKLHLHPKSDSDHVTDRFRMSLPNQRVPSHSFWFAHPQHSICPWRSRTDLIQRYYVPWSTGKVAFLVKSHFFPTSIHVVFSLCPNFNEPITSNFNPHPTEVRSGADRKKKDERDRKKQELPTATQIEDRLKESNEYSLVHNSTSRLHKLYKNFKWTWMYDQGWTRQLQIRPHLH